ncbi:MAG TPA: phytoene/squalene synthase family protein [Polyangia bacterium]|nr:phytoene/squalene synthase family protein [Polyangia bacterium]
MMDAERAAHAALAAGSKSFALAGKLLPRRTRDDAAVLYAWCRRCDDAIDLAPPAERPAALRRMREELDTVYAGAPIADPTLAAFAGVVRRCEIPRSYPSGLLDGFQMDVDGVRYATVAELLGYAYRVAGTVGVMMAYVMGASGTEPLRRAAHLGMAMQLTNICRDVDEDWRNGRVYLPDELVGGPLAPGAETPLDPTVAAGAMARLLARARAFYESGEGGLEALRFRCAGAIRAAGLIYADIGRLIAARGHDIRRGRAVVSRGRKLWLVARAFVVEAALRTRRAVARVPEVLP